MAINFNNYVEKSAPAGGQQSGNAILESSKSMGTGLAKIGFAVPRIMDHNIMNHAHKFLRNDFGDSTEISGLSDIVGSGGVEEWSQHFMPKTNAEGEAIPGFSFDDINAGKSYVKYLEHAQKKRIKGGLGPVRFKRAQKSGLLSPVGYKQYFDGQVRAIAPMIEEQLKNYQDLNGLKDEEMRAFISNQPGLRNFLIKYGDPQGSYRMLSAPEPKGFFGNWGRTIAGGTAAAAAVGYGMYNIKRPGAWGTIPRDLFTKGAWKTPIPEIGTKTGVKIFDDLESALHQNLSKYQSLLKKHGGEGVKNNPVAKALRATIKAQEKEFASLATKLRNTGLLEATTRAGKWAKNIKNMGIGIGLYSGVGALTGSLAEAAGGDYAVGEAAGHLGLTTSFAVGKAVISKMGPAILTAALLKMPGMSRRLMSILVKAGFGGISGIFSGGLGTALSIGLVAADVYFLMQAINNMAEEQGIDIGQIEAGVNDGLQNRDAEAPQNLPYTPATSSYKVWDKANQQWGTKEMPSTGLKWMLGQ
jgi:hypothetical protein